MKVINKSININTLGDCDIKDITPAVRSIVAQSGMVTGTVNIFICGSTAGITTIEYEPGLIIDLKEAFNRMVPQDITYQHNARWGDGNGHSHVRASLLGSSIVVPFVNNNVVLGTWQQIVVVDFDNRPRTREILLQITGE